MSKYIKLYDAIMAMAEWFSEPITPTQILSDLPTIEVSDEQLSKLKSRENSVENTTVSEDFTSISRANSKLEVSEDCISREYMLRALNGYGKDWQEDCEIADVIRNAPSVDVMKDGVFTLTDVTDSVIVSESVVRCKDCTHYHAFKDYAYCTVINVKGKHPQPTDYCSYAEEKTFT